MATLAMPIAGKLADIVRSKYCKSTSQVIECMLALVHKVQRVPEFVLGQDGETFLDICLPVFMGHVQHNDWLARKAAILGIALLVEAAQNKQRLSCVKNDLLHLLGPMRSDKYKPVRESTTEAIIEVKKIPDELKFN
jgi:hypothetical protein